MKESIVRSVEGLYEQRTLELVKIAIHKGFGPIQILSWLQAGMERVGEHYEACDYFIADLIFAGIIFQEVMDLEEFKTLYTVPDVPKVGCIMTASVYGDCHDIGKHMFGSFARTAGFDVVDIGVDVPTNEIIESALSHSPDIIALSGMQQSTQAEMQSVCQALEARGIRQNYKIIIGGAFIEDGESHKILGADYATKDITKAVQLCKKWVQEK